ncbi:MAG TPA: hypothetical protein VMS56_10110 [Thermoanaerobaculia bacterium]|nr:hypothetical protein [Thermoanaerobaculia bacterium]
MTGSSRRGRSERGFALIAALLLAVLYLSLMELTLRDTSETIRQAHRFRARISAEILAENALELAAERMVELSSKSSEIEEAEGTAEGSYQRLPGDRFELHGSATSLGAASVSASVTLRGRFVGTDVRILESETH